MEDAQSPPKKSTTLSVDRAAFLLLRVKKAFKKKRQQRKEKQTQAANAALISQTRTGRGKVPPPLFRSRTLPAIIVPGIPVVSLNTDRQFDERCGGGLMGTKSGSGTSTGGGGTNRWSLLSRQTPTTPGYINNNNNNNMVNIKSLNLPKDDMGVYRRKSSGSTTSHSSGGTSTSISGTPVAGSQVADAALLMPTCEDFESHAADGSVLLRIPAPHVVAARAYRLASKKRSNTNDNQQNRQQQQQPYSSSNMSIIAGIAGMGGSFAAEPQQPTTPEGVGSGGNGSGIVCTGGSGNSEVAAGSAGNTALTRRIAKLLHQSSVTASKVGTVVSPHGDGPTTSGTNKLLPITAANAASRDGSDADGKDDAPRRLSWERRKDSSALQRSASIDSFAEIVWSDTPRPSLEIPRPSVVPFSKRPSASSLFSNCSFTSQTTQLNINYGAGGVGDQCSSGSSAGNSRRESLLSPSSTRRNKLTRIINALFSAVEHGHLDKARTILESTDVDVNSINTDGLSALDVAVLSNNRSMTKMLLQHGAIEGTQFSTDTIGNKLNGLLKDAESRIQDLSGTSDGGLCQPSFSTRPSISSIIIGNTGSSVTGCTGNEIEKQIGIWERRVKGLRRLLLGWDQTRPPDAPAAVTVDVTGENSIALQIIEPFDGAIGTKFKVQWSTRADFSNIVGERELVDWMSFHGNMGTQCKIGGLTQGRRYFIRATCGNVKGWGPFKTSVPASVVPSCWRDYNNREDRYVGRQLALDNLFTAVRLARPADVSELTLDVCPAQRRNPKKKTTIKQLFSVASKFQKHLRRGIYLASIIYCEDKVLVTSEDFLPVIEIDETYSSSLHSDYHWLMKVACTWDDVKSLRTDMERNLTSAVHFRTKLLSAVCQLQSTLGLNDLGQLFYKPLRDSHGTVVLTCIQAVKSQKTVSILNSRWLPLNKLQKKIVALLEDYNIHDMLISSIAEQIHYHQASMQRLSPGLYLGYLKMQCSMDQIQVVVPIKTPNVLPHCKVRDNSHITADEWQFLKRRNTSRPGSRSSSPLNMAFEFGTYLEETTEGQRLFLYDLTTATQKLFSYMNIKPQDAETHRLYDIEVIEHSKDISFLIICPAVELTCAVPGQPELLLQRDDLASLSIQSFEMIHLRTYQPGIIQKYARLSCILELDTALATHSHREAFSTSELQTAKERLAKLHELSANLNAVWKSVRWLMDVIAFARDKNTQSSEIMKEILAFGSSSSGNKGVGESSQDTQLLQPPSRDAKYTKNSGRGSWPGPGASHSSGNNCLAAEHSKSEQNLGRSAITPTSCAQSLPMQQSANKSNSSSDSRKTASSTSTQAHLLQVSGMSGYTSSDISLRKNSGDSMTSSQYTTRSYYSGAESALGSNNELEQIFTIPPSRSDDTLALASLKVGKHTHATAMQRRQRTTSNITQHAPTPTSLASSTHCSNSAPYLSTGSSNISLKTSSSSDYDIKAPKASSQAVAEHSIDGKVKAASSANMRDGSLYRKSNLEPPTKDIIKPTTSSEERSSSATSTLTTTAKTASIKSLSRHSSQEDTSSGSSQRSEQAANAPSSGIIQVYTAYNTGLASGTSLKLHVTPKTTAREVINLVVKQLNMAAVLKGNNGPIYTADMLDNFCLVAVIGARERCLRDDFKPLQLQNPWRKGRLYVRQKHELLAAIEHANRKSHLI
ncbi:ankyrin repeat and fibronectin type-III domain-containing protein 1 isoform X2 [Eurosta solidaginis]|uniref:ankyrin repeat and fibronectin type-III domain-containing protein 1 isoform X2 n=1 Tax=Eurosta solidaginis TaxID=178769 RepID=UPI0035311B8B